MYASQTIFIDQADLIVAIVERDPLPVSPAIQIWNADMTGSPVMLIFGPSNQPSAAKVAVERLVQALLEVQLELERRSRNVRSLTIAGAGDPTGESPDAPVDVDQ